jgi:hypothetical protein
VLLGFREPTSFSRWFSQDFRGCGERLASTRRKEKRKFALSEVCKKRRRTPRAWRTAFAADY